MKTSELSDVKILALKRWNLPQTKSVLYEQGEKGYGEYISFQSHHFFDILSVKPGTIPAAYSQLATIRAYQQVDQQKDVHIVQSLTIIGKDNGFWTEKADRLYVTFLQLGNSKERSFDKLEKAIGDAIRRFSRGKKTKWALYYALDFCDLVLFTKGLNLNAYHNILWNLALVGGGVLDGVRDTFTMYGFHRDYLKNAFCAIDSNKSYLWNERMALSVNLSLQSMSSWTQLAAELRRAGISYQVHRTSGRYDLNLTTKLIPGTKVLKLLRAIDGLCTGSTDTVFGGYEVQFLAPPWRVKKLEPKNAIQDRSFEKEANQLMDLLCDKYCTTHEASADYVEETCRSFKALLKNGFSEEYVLSVFISFVAFLRISLLFEKQGVRSPVTQRLERMNRKYFTELNTLALCTMHNERQFIQAPAFNASYFDIPPKLLTFYNGVVSCIVQALWDGNEPIYRFLIAPDYKNDIYVSPLLVDEEKQTEERLAVIRLCEQYFYDPVNALALLCHEISHYMSDRKRETRAKGIFYMVSLSILYRTHLLTIVDSVDAVIDGTSILDLLAKILAEAILEIYNDRWWYQSDSEKYLLSNVKAFLSANGYGIGYFAEQQFSEDLVKRWENGLSQAYQSGKLNEKELREALERIEKPLHTSFISEMLKQEQPEGIFQVFSILARDILLQIRRIESQSLNGVKHQSYCNDIMETYSEAYADVKMAQVMGECFSISLYENLLYKICDTNGLLSKLRHDAVCTVVAQGVEYEEWSGEYVSDIDRLVYTVAVCRIREYLEQCYQPKMKSSQIEHAGLTFQKPDIGEQLMLVYDHINWYREEIRTYCQDVLRAMDDSTTK